MPLGPFGCFCCLFGGGGLGIGDFWAVLESTVAPSGLLNNETRGLSVTCGIGIALCTDDKGPRSTCLKVTLSC